MLRFCKMNSQPFVEVSFKNTTIEKCMRGGLLQTKFFRRRSFDVRICSSMYETKVDSRLQMRPLLHQLQFAGIVQHFLLDDTMMNGYANAVDIITMPTPEPGSKERPKCRCTKQPSATDESCSRADSLRVRICACRAGMHTRDIISFHAT